MSGNSLACNLPHVFTHACFDWSPASAPRAGPRPLFTQRTFAVSYIDSYMIAFVHLLLYYFRGCCKRELKLTPCIIESESLLPCSQHSAAAYCPNYLNPVRTLSHDVFTIRFNIILFTPMSVIWCFPSGIIIMMCSKTVYSSYSHVYCVSYPSFF
jgi:hypothetical protein